jgi:GTPase SAR1 family protein
MAVDIPSYKVILCGEYGVGKTTLFVRFKDDQFMADADDVCHDYASRTYTVNGKKVMVCCPCV